MELNSNSLENETLSFAKAIKNLDVAKSTPVFKKFGNKKPSKILRLSESQLENLRSKKCIVHQSVKVDSQKNNKLILVNVDENDDNNISDRHQQQNRMNTNWPQLTFQHKLCSVSILHSDKMNFKKQAQIERKWLQD